MDDYSWSGSLDGLVCFAAQVGMKLRDDYGVSVDTLRQPWFAAQVHRLWNQRHDASSATFIIANERVNVA
jgi:hypothetical protein